MKKKHEKTRSAGERISVWMIDDNKSFCYLLSEALNESDTVVCERTFHSCAAAFDALVKEDGEPPAVILLDIKMPRLSGLDAVAKLRELTPGSKIVMLTSFDSDENIRVAVRQGASGYLLKTSSPAEIESAIVNANKGGAALDATIAKRVLQAYLGQNESNPYHLTKREQEVLRCAATGLTVKQMAEALKLSFFTVENHLRSIHRKFQVHNRQSLIVKATKERLI